MGHVHGDSCSDGSPGPSALAPRPFPQVLLCGRSQGGKNGGNTWGHADYLPPSFREKTTPTLQDSVLGIKDNPLVSRLLPILVLAACVWWGVPFCLWSVAVQSLSVATCVSFPKCGPDVIALPWSLGCMLQSLQVYFGAVGIFLASESETHRPAGLGHYEAIQGNSFNCCMN